MSKLPVVSGADVVRALGKVGFVVYRQRGLLKHSLVVISPWCAATRQRKQQFPIIRNSIAALCAAIIRQSGLTVEEFVALL